jgi:hypothetical protein
MAQRGVKTMGQTHASAHRRWLLLLIPRIRGSFFIIFAVEKDTEDRETRMRRTGGQRLYNRVG